jgi:DNA mismatch repair protein MutS2
MHPGALKALEFDRIVEAAASFALTPIGRARILDLCPLHETASVEIALATTTETVAYLADHPGFPLRAPESLTTILDAVAVEGRMLDPSQLLGLADFLGSVEQCATGIRRVPAGSVPLLRRTADVVASFEREIAEVRQAIDASGEVSDQASPELRAIRERLRKQRSRLRSTLESYLRGRETARYLQEQVVTDRSGRYVLVVRAEHRAAIPGIVHGSSASGASLYLEPLSTVEINNEIVALQEREAEEISRILLALTDAFRRRPGELQQTVEVATELDLAQAKARLATAMDAVAPRISTDTGLDIKAGRHPLLIPAIAARLGAPVERQSRPIPVDIVLAPPATVLVISGPNTGGKTVALKLAGLLALMAKAGLHVPADPGSRLPVFRSIFADIGDEQSIATNLSTFSWHMTNIVAMERSLALPGLVLLDEVGAGTDPTEGAALGLAIIEHFRRRGAVVIATTHDDTVKSYAATTSGVVCASFGFDPDRFTPTYRLVYGTPGRSLAFEVAARLGLPAGVVERARQVRSARETQLAAHLQQVDSELRRLEEERRAVARERQQLADRASALEGREEDLRQRDERLRRKLDERLDERLRAARLEIDRVVDDLKVKAASLAQDVGRTAAGLTTGDIGHVRTTARLAVEEIAERVSDHPRAEDDAAPEVEHVQADRPAIGDRVRVGGLGLEGILRQIHDRDAEVDVRGKRLRVPLADLHATGRPTPAAPPKVTLSLGDRDGSFEDLNVIGCTVDEARARAEKFLDDALVAERRTVRVIHGHGTGQLRRALAELLHDHPLVARFGAAPAEQGGGGVTVIELKE